MNHELPKSITLMADLFCCFSSTFSGFMSQWIMFSFLSSRRLYTNYIANRLTSPRLIPLKLFIFINSNKLMFNNSNDKHKCFRNRNELSIMTLLYSHFLSASLKRSKTSISTAPCRWNLFLLRITFNALPILRLWSQTLKTWPKVPFPSIPYTSYLYAIWSPSIMV